MEIEINSEEILQEMQRQFPKETQICVQAVQIRKLSELAVNENRDKETEAKLEIVEDAEVQS